jgi:aspartyl protease family protein
MSSRFPVLLLALAGAAAGADPPPPESVTIAADARGFYQVQAQLNGVPVRVVVDTGASAIYLGRAQAAALGIDHARGRRAEMTTFRGPRTIWVVKLERVQVGALSARDVDAWIVEEGDEGAPQPLLGMSFLRRFDVRVGGGAMTLSERARQ